MQLNTHTNRFHSITFTWNSILAHNIAAKQLKIVLIMTKLSSFASLQKMTEIYHILKEIKYFRIKLVDTINLNCSLLSLLIDVIVGNKDVSSIYAHYTHFQMENCSIHTLFLCIIYISSG